MQRVENERKELGIGVLREELDHLPRAVVVVNLRLGLWLVHEQIVQSGQGVVDDGLDGRAEQANEGRHAARLEQHEERLLVGGQVLQHARDRVVEVELVGVDHQAEQSVNQRVRGGQGQATGVLPRQLVDKLERLGHHLIVLVA